MLCFIIKSLPLLNIYIIWLSAPESWQTECCWRRIWARCRSFSWKTSRFLCFESNQLDRGSWVGGGWYVSAVGESSRWQLTDEMLRAPRFQGLRVRDPSAILDITREEYITTKIRYYSNKEIPAFWRENISGYWLFNGLQILNMKMYENQSPSSF